MSLKRDVLMSMLLVALVSALPVCARQASVPETSHGRNAGRIMPPVASSCDRNRLTSYSGIVIAYHRDANATRITIRTDWDTEEAVTVSHPDSNDPTSRFLLFNEPFDAQSWQRIESEPGVLHENMRATAWVCEDGDTPPVIDWRPGEDAIDAPGRSSRP